MMTWSLRLVGVTDCAQRMCLCVSSAGVSGGNTCIAFAGAANNGTHLSVSLGDCLAEYMDPIIFNTGQLFKFEGPFTSRCAEEKTEAILKGT